MIFRKVSKSNPIRINGTEYNKVDFEIKNPVINYPSSVDVKLSNDNKDVLFIESKLYEVVRDSSEKGIPVIGPSYLSNNKNGYKEKLNLDHKKLEEIGINLPFDSDDEMNGEKDASEIKKMYGEKDASEIKKRIVEITGNKKGYLSVDPILKNEWVYSYGIKQILSHIIGILNYEGSPLKKRKFAYIYNELPDFKEKSAQEKIKSYNSHVTKVCNELKDCNKTLETVLETPIITYQKLYEENTEYFSRIEKNICSYYKLDRKDKKTE